MSGERTPMGITDSTAEFFDELGRRGHEPLLGKVRSSVRFDVVDGKQTQTWSVTIDKGTIVVSRRKGACDCVLRADKASFDRVAAGELNAMAAVLRGELSVEGDPRVFVRHQRLFPGPPSRRAGRRAAGSARRKA
jgi:putative sterol carrier protein